MGHTDIFILLNIVRGLSIIGLVLLFASSIVTLVQDVKAVNAFIAEGSHHEILVSSGNSTETVDCSDMDYVPYVALFLLTVRISPCAEAARCPISPRARSGLSSIACSSSSKSLSSSSPRSAGPRPSSAASSPS